MKATKSTAIDHPPNGGYLLDELLFVRGTVERGYGRGSKKLGFPTANLPQFDESIAQYNLPRGVYFGWAKLEDEPEIAHFVANIGRSPTFAGQVSLNYLALSIT